MVFYEIIERDMKQTNDSNAWSLYWSEDRLYSCVAQSSDEDQQVLNTLWQEFAQKMVPGSRLLDLATGNGAVAHSVLSANSRVQIDAVDKASIDPKKTLKGCDSLNSVHFHSNTDLFDLSFEPLTFDAISSQFGIEYAGLEAVSVRVMPYLKVGGRFQFIIHHAQSGIILSSKNKIIEFEQLTQKSGVLETLIAVLGGKAEFAQLEKVGKEYLQQDLLRTDSISGQVFAGIEHIISHFNSQPKESLELGVSIDLRVRSELIRLQQLIVAGQSLESMESWQQEISAMGLEVSFNPLYLDSSKKDYLLGWLASGVRCK